MFLALSYAMDTPENREGLMKLQPRIPVTKASIIRRKREQTDSTMTSIQKIKRSLTMTGEVVEGEVLVDAGLLSWAYFEAGIIEAIGCLTCYFFALWYHFEIMPADAVKFGGSWGKGDITLQNSRVLVYIY